MTLEEAIKHCEEIAELKYDEGNEARLQEQDKYADECVVCAAKHRQLAEWLKELKERKEKDVPDPISRQAVLDLIADYDLSMGQVVRGIHALPSVQPEIIRCKDCKWSDWYTACDGNRYCYCMETGNGGRTENDYCSYAERRTDGKD